MDHQKLKAIVEALIFVAEEPMTANSLLLVLSEADVDKVAIKQAIESLQQEYAERNGGIELREVAGGWQFRTQADAAEWVARLNVPKPVRLSQAALETLAMVAYRQPIVRAEVEEIRGVDCGGVLKTLLERNLIKIVGKRDDPGTPLLYGTTKEFLSLFNMQSLKDLPTLREFHELEQPSNLAMDGVELPAEPIQDLDPIEPISVNEQIAQENEDQGVIDELEQELKSLRRMEKNVFPSEHDNHEIESN